jgi:hypothetical protein
MGLKHIGFQSISNSKSDIVASVPYGMGRPYCKREEPQAFGKRNRLDPVEMNSRVLLLPLLRIDMDFMTLTGHSRAEVNKIPFRPPFSKKKVLDPNR